jgi:hypothetical protein
MPIDSTFPRQSHGSRSQFIVIGLCFLSILLYLLFFPTVNSLDMQEKAENFIKNYEPTFKKLTIEIGEAWWASSVSGKVKNFRSLFYLYVF